MPEEFACAALPIKAQGLQGAGDSMLAGLLSAMARGKNMEDALAFASVTAAASVMRPGTLLARKEDIAALLPLSPVPVKL